MIDDIEKVVREGADLSNGDFREQDLSGKQLIGAKFARCDFTGADLSGSFLIDADLSGAILVDADLHSADLIGANLAGANLTGADLDSADITNTDFTGAIGIFDAGLDPRQYRFLGVRMANGSYRVKAGCRWFTISRAKEHWSAKGNLDALARVAAIEAHALVERSATEV